ncbi:hypothetical protein B0H17DRAFT_1048207 [Mycena rosella]|uniref:Uncharacterized protein n=1 Tax=Mycena rosella TaxID=1033263 RepID=A0AAD7DWL2_MYCRO|nr:hypothetical protein B0H17DRAFT_1048207 [Mycena rosella]
MDASAILGQYMLKGWVLTDRSCPTVGCSVPLMRSPNGRTPVTHFCANCDGGPDSIRPPAAQIPDYAASISSSSHISRSSTPPTEVSSTLSSPVFALPAETEESRRRREQSDAASSAIGQRLLKVRLGNAGDECPNARCFGVPLVRPPKAGGEKDPRKECVICGTVYITEVDWAGRERLIPEESTKSIATPITSKGKAREIEDTTLHVETRNSAGFEEPKNPIRLPPSSIHPSGETTVKANPMLAALDESAQALDLTLRALSTRLSSLTAGHADPSSIGSVADAVSKVVQALAQVRQLQWAEKHAGETL